MGRASGLQYGWHAIETTLGMRREAASRPVTKGLAWPRPDQDACTHQARGRADPPWYCQEGVQQPCGSGLNPIIGGCVLMLADGHAKASQVGWKADTPPGLR